MTESSFNKSYELSINEDALDNSRPQLLRQYTSIFMYRAQKTEFKCLGLNNYYPPNSALPTL